MNQKRLFLMDARVFSAGKPETLRYRASCCEKRGRKPSKNIKNVDSQEEIKAIISQRVLFKQRSCRAPGHKVIMWKEIFHKLAISVISITGIPMQKTLKTYYNKFSERARCLMRVRRSELAIFFKSTKIRGHNHYDSMQIEWALITVLHAGSAGWNVRV